MQRMANAIQFQLSEGRVSGANSLLRRGRVEFSKKKKTIETPACLTYTIRGSVPHLVTENLQSLPVEWLQVTLEQFVAEKEPSSLKFPHGLHKYLNLEDHILFCDMRDPLKEVPVPFNTDKHLSVSTYSGIRNFTPELWAKAIKAYKPDLCALMSDIITYKDPKRKRIKRSVDRTLRWLDECLPKAQTAGIPAFAPVVGYDDLGERTRSSQLTAERDVQGFILNLFGVPKDRLADHIRASLDPLPKEKPRLSYGLASPEGILLGVANGVDLFDGSYAYKVTENGRATVFKFGEPDTNETKQSKTLNLWDKNLSQSFEPIDASCGCPTCTAPHTKAYIHHLLNAHEMLGPLLLMSHNMYQLDLFMASIRQSLKEGRFEKDAAAFMKRYSHEAEDDGGKNHDDELNTDSLGVQVKRQRALD